MHNTGNPLGSKDILDLYDNSEVVDNFVNSQEDSFPDRFGTKRLTLAGLIKRSMALRNEINDFSGALTFRPEWSDVPMNVSVGVGGEGGALNLQAEALGNRSEINKVTSREALRRSYAEAGFNLIGDFSNTGLVVNSVTDVVLWESTGVAYSYAGPLPHTIGEDETPVGNPLWVAKAGVTLRTNLAASGGADLIGTPDGTVQDNLNALNFSAETDVNAFYRYKIVKILPIAPPLVKSVATAHGYSYLYPQGYCYGKNGDIWFNLTSNNNVTWVARYDATGQAVSMFEGISGTSEVAHFYSEGGQDYYVMGCTGTLKKFNVTSLPAGESIQAPVSTWSVDVLFGGCGFFGNKMLLEEATTPVGTINRRYRLFVFNLTTGLRETSFDVPLQIAGAFNNTPLESYVHKSQGIAANGRGLYLSHGKNSPTATDKDVVHALGISLMNWSGEAETTALITADRFRQFLVSQGLNPTRTENEGVAIVDGYPYVLNTYLTSFSSVEATTGGIAICSIGEPFGSTDLSDGAIAPVTGQYYGKSVGGYYNPYTGQLMDTIAKMMDYMFSTDLAEFTFYTSGFTILDLNGVAFPPSHMVEIFNPNNLTFWYRVTGTKTQNLYYTTDRVNRAYASFIGNGKNGDVTNTIAGVEAANSMTSPLAVANTIYGRRAGYAITSGAGNSLFGQNSFDGLTTGNYNAGLGLNSGRFLLDGVTPANTTHSVAIGTDSRLSGDNQIQLGNSTTVPYAYAALQIRSDARDKVDVMPTSLGDEFIDGLEAVEGRWDLRDDYWEEYDEEVGVDAEGGPVFETKRRRIPMDGSKKRTRKHQWFIAQQVKAVCDELGVDFSGYQDHSINGGCDVKTLAYEHFIPPMTAYMQRRKVEIRALEATVTSQQEAIELLAARLSALEPK